jgi:hypothetical protein
MDIYYPPTLFEVKHNPSVHVPKNGDRFVVTDFSVLEGCGASEIARVAKLPYLTVEESMATPMGEGVGSYEWGYVLFVKEFPGMMLISSDKLTWI